ncbi:7,8-dihydropterin-6-yl-methyl-4-(beta-D-ribofuranosyl)aminobenzene 5'-phosphate synthase [Natronincola peptidivorans]|uniref:7,8-dihydropterin-6-yl-methyl-4-(Beta-D-ribofuranosyl)aminobenzene 5'-phosphate synthase n=1 Tax=Natronincola peptidivorans TaxID=426128 RepID=A0A1I0CGG8_9FIRM|nr:MBL fold metallo-hydrolase [Natronincola peptidivorans]SET18036.1 7,8-dihydropterin-6-yl-methyl-4-(beta-D-ribofuranosyl)aminobenzene 5'-phosphate synthase [Natronincola peptidivorans]
MKLTILLDNNTLIDRYFYGEPGVSYFIELEDMNILFDAGYSDAFIRNAQKMNISLRNIDTIVISHGHIDHTWGLYDLIKLYTEATIENINYNKPQLMAHPLAFKHKQISDKEEIGSILTEEKLAKHFHMTLSKEPVWITDKLVFLGEIERTNHFENKKPIGKTQYNAKEVDDYLLDDSALAYKSTKGLVIITGCSHAGICNIIEYAKKVCQEDRIFDIVGGFHLLDPTEELLKYTTEYIEQRNINQMHAGHCTDLKSKIALSKAVTIKEMGVGLVLKYS